MMEETMFDEKQDGEYYIRDLVMARPFIIDYVRKDNKYELEMLYRYGDTWAILEQVEISDISKDESVRMNRHIFKEVMFGDMVVGLENNQPGYLTSLIADMDEMVSIDENLFTEHERYRGVVSAHRLIEISHQMNMKLLYEKDNEKVLKIK